MMIKVVILFCAVDVVVNPFLEWFLNHLGALCPMIS